MLLCLKTLYNSLLKLVSLEIDSFIRIGGIQQATKSLIENGIDLYMNFYSDMFTKNVLKIIKLAKDLLSLLPSYLVHFYMKWS